MKTKNLPVYKEIYELTRLMTKYYVNINRMFKPNIGDKLCNTSIDLLSDIIKANSSTNIIERREYIRKTKDSLTLIDTMVTLCRDMQLMSAKDYANLILKIDSISKQLCGWEKKTDERIAMANGQG